MYASRRNRTPLNILMYRRKETKMVELPGRVPAGSTGSISCGIVTSRVLIFCSVCPVEEGRAAPPGPARVCESWLRCCGDGEDYARHSRHEAHSVADPLPSFRTRSNDMIDALLVPCVPYASPPPPPPPFPSPRADCVRPVAAIAVQAAAAGLANRSQTRPPALRALGSGFP